MGGGVRAPGEGKEKGSRRAAIISESQGELRGRDFAFPGKCVANPRASCMGENPPRERFRATRALAAIAARPRRAVIYPRSAAPGRGGSGRPTP